jgi:Uma2 family endonuclease
MATARRHGDATPLPEAPEICIEVRSPSNTDAEMAMKTRAHLAAGAREVWIVSVSGEREVFTRQGLQTASGYPLTIRLDAA